MPIVSQKTDLNIVKYERDSGPSLTPPSIPTTTPPDSTVPYITVPIPKIGDKLPGITDFRVNRTNIPNTGLSGLPGTVQGSVQGLFGGSLLDTIRGNTSGYNDNFIRGGILGTQQAIIRDRNRIDAFVRDNTIFGIKQERLQRSNVLFEAKGEQPSRDGIITYNAVGRSVLTYKVNNTLQQITGNAYGEHNLRHGSGGNIENQSREETYYKNAIENSQIGLSTGNDSTKALKTNRLLVLYSKPELQIQSNSKTLGGTVNIPISSALPPSNASVSNNNPTYFGGLFSRGSRGGTRIVTLNELKQRAQNQLVNFENRVNQIVGRTALGSVVLSSLQALGVNTNINLTDRLGVSDVARTFRSIDTDKPISTLYRYSGGPGKESVYGVGQTVITRYEFTGDPEKISQAYGTAGEKAGKAIYSDDQQSVELTYVSPGGSGSVLQRALGNIVGKNVPISTHPEVITDISEIARAIGQAPPVLGPSSARTYANIVAARDTPLAQTFNKLNIFNTVIDKTTYSNIGSYSNVTDGKIEYKNTYDKRVVLNYRSWDKVSREQRVGSGRQDSINLTPLFISDTGFNAAKITINKNNYTVNDLVKFKIEGINTDDPYQSTNMVFRAYLTDFSDGVSAEWGDVTYAGRGDKFYIYKGFDRKISIGFKVAALSAEEMKPMYQKLNNLMGNLLPDYSNGLMRGPLVRMTVGNWIDSQPGIFTSLDYTVSQETPWEIALNELAGGSKEMVLPHIVDVKLSFTPIGAQTKKDNKIMNKATETQHTSYIAQNYNGDSSGEPNYIDGSKILTATPYKEQLTKVTGSNIDRGSFAENPTISSTITRTPGSIAPFVAATPTSTDIGTRPADLTDAEYAAQFAPAIAAVEARFGARAPRRRRRGQ